MTPPPDEDPVVENGGDTPKDSCLEEKVATTDGISHIFHVEAFEMWESSFLFVDARRTKT